MDVGSRHSDRLVSLAKGGDRDALRELWEDNRRWVAAVILAHKPTEADVDDVLQEVAATLCAKVGAVSDAGAFRGWLRTVAVNAARLAGRKQGVKEKHEGVLGARLGADGDVGGERGGGIGLVEQEEARRVLEAARGLPAEYREPLMLRAVQGLSYRNIGEILGLPETTIETRIARGRRMLREAMAGAGVPKE